MTRPLEAATAAGFDQPVIPLAALVYLDILNDPLWAWTGLGNLTFGASETGDPSLDGKTFIGIGNIMEIGNVSEGAGGSDSLDILFPGVDMNDQLAKQVITDRRRWQFRRAIVWLALLDDSLDIVGEPFRIKTGRMDNMPYDESGDKAVIKCVIEGQQAYGSEPLNTRYSEQIDIDNTDTSQKWAHYLSNMTAEIGKKTSVEINNIYGGGTTGGSSGGYSGGGFLGALLSMVRAV